MFRIQWQGIVRQEYLSLGIFSSGKRMLSLSYT